MLWLFGGNANNGSICGLSASNANNVFSNANTNIGAQLTLKIRNKIFDIPANLAAGDSGRAKNRKRQVTVLVG